MKFYDLFRVLNVVEGKDFGEFKEFKGGGGGGVLGSLLRFVGWWWWVNGVSDISYGKVKCRT